MRVFQDCDGHDWEVDLTIGAAEPLEVFLKEKHDVDIFNATQTLANLGRPTFALSCLSLLCRAQREARGMSSDDFLNAFRGEPAYRAQRCLIEEYVDFFPDPAVQDELSSVLTKSLSLSEQEQLLIRRSLTLAVTKYEEVVNGLAKTLSENDSESGPESPGSGPNTKSSRSANSKRSRKRTTKTSGRKRPQ